MINRIPTVIITGASGGIGRALAARFAGGGYRLLLTAHKSAPALRAFAERLSAEKGVPVHVFKADLSSSEETRQLMREILREDPSPDVLINNAGTACVRLVQDMTEEAFDYVMDLNFKAAFLCSQAVIPAMIRQKSGCIVNISSVWGEIGASMESVYSASKGALNAFTKALAKELAPSGIRVNAVSAGVIDTPMNDCFSPEEKDALTGEIPLGRFGTPQEVSEIAWFLASEASSYVTGQILRADGAWQ